MYRFFTSLSSRVRIRMLLIPIASFLPVVVIAAPATNAAAAHFSSRLGAHRLSAARPIVHEASTSSQNSGPINANAVEITGDRTAYSSTYALPDGQNQTKLSSLPMNYKDASGNWQKIDTSLVSAASSGWHDAAGSVDVSLPSSLSSAVTVSSGTTSVGFTLQGGAGSGSVSGSTANYRSVLPATSASYLDTGAGLKENLELASASAPSSFAWSLSLSSGLSPELAPDGGLTLLANGSQVGSIAPPTVTDAAGVTGTATYTLSADGTTLTLNLDPTWLSASGRAFPVAVDPSVYLGASNACTLEAANPNTSYCNTVDTSVGANVGSAERGIVYFPGLTDGTIPVDSVVQGSILAMPIDTLTGSVTVNAYPLTRTFTSSATWNKYDGTNSWTTAGGDYATSPTTSMAVTSGSYMNMNMSTALNQNWIYGSTASDGIELKATNESSGTNIVNFEPQDDYSDFLIVTWTANGGMSKAFPLYTHQLDDHLSLAVNTANGNLSVHATDLTIAGTGLPEVFDRYYNSADENSYSSAGIGWSTGAGADIQAQVNYDNVTIYLPGQQPEVFLDNGSSWITPPGVNGVLTSPSSGNYALTLNQSQEVFTFNANANCGDHPLSSIKDRNGDTITYNYATSGYCSPDGLSKLNSITDTQSRTTTVSELTFMTGLTDPQTPTARTVGYWQGAYSSSQLTKTEDTSGNYTYYSYDSSDSLLRKITDPNGNITLINYDGSNRVLEHHVCDRYPAHDGTDLQLLLQPGLASTPDSGYTIVTDPLSHTTKYYYDHLDDTPKVIDGDGNTRSATYNSDSQPLTLTNAAGTTNLGYEANNNLTSASPRPPPLGRPGAPRAPRIRPDRV